jgi:CheY-like chemotaxis protein
VAEADVLEKPVSREALRAVLRRVAGPSRLRALLVDDEADARLLVEHALRESGVTVRTARDGHEALLDLERELPDVLILDLRMPRMTGETLLRELRAEPRTSELPVIIVTAKELDSGERARLEGLGAQVVRKGEALAAELRRAIMEALAPRPTARAR